jgi:hypothetical protein
MEMTGSLPVPSVQAMVAAGRHAPVPPRYLRPDLAADVVVADDATTIPIIDFQRLLLVDPEESARLHAACQDWGFFQVGFLCFPFFLACQIWMFMMDLGGE